LKNCKEVKEQICHKKFLETTEDVEDILDDLSVLKENVRELEDKAEQYNEYEVVLQK